MCKNAENCTYSDFYALTLVCRDDIINYNSMIISEP